MSAPFSVRHRSCPHRLRPLAALLLAGLSVSPSLLAQELTLPAVTVQAGPDQGAEPTTEESALYTTTRSSSAAGLGLTLRETPQSVTVLGRQQLDDFALHDINQALESASAIGVEQVETDRTYYTARGFEVTQFQYDGLGVPFAYELMHGDVDTAIFDRIDVVYGATGLTSGTGQPGAIINFVRKRPTATPQGDIGLSAGSWNSYRLEGDISRPLNASGSVRGRLVLVWDRGDSWLDRYARDKQVAYGIVEADLSPQTRLSVGHSYQKNEADSPLWGALPLINSDGTPTDYPSSTSTSTDWAWWNSSTASTFIELQHQLHADWRASLQLRHNQLKNDGELFYVYGSPDAASGEGLFAWPSAYRANNRQKMADVGISGSYALGGRRHELHAGLNWASSELDDRSDYGTGIGDPVPPLAGWNGQFPRPQFNSAVDGSHFHDQRRSVYLANRFALTDSLRLIVGARWTTMDLHGQSYQVARNAEASKVTPYAGVVYALSPEISVYASHARIFDPQHETDIDGNVLAPVEGLANEIGFKAGFNRDTFNVSMAVFDVQQNDLAQEAGWGDNGTYYAASDARSRGAQVELSGRFTPAWQGSLSWVGLTLDDADGQPTRTWVPRQQVRLSTRYAPAALAGLKVGGSVSWQDETSATSASGTLVQEAYALLNLMASYDFSPRVSAQLNVNNVTDERYVSSLYWGYLGQGWYGAPRQVEASVNWKF